jgi:hypothetical protein
MFRKLYVGVTDGGAAQYQAYFVLEQVNGPIDISGDKVLAHGKTCC